MRGLVLVSVGVLLGGTASAQVPALTDLGTFPNGGFSEALAVNSSGVVVGEAVTVGGSLHAALWAPGAAAADLGTLSGGSESRAFGVNDLGQVVGVSDGVDATGAGFSKHAFFAASAGAELLDLGTLPGGSTSYAMGVNASGLVVGRSDDGFSTHAFAWTSAGGMRDLGTLGGDFSEAAAVNSAGDVVGDSTAPSGNNHAALWTADGTVTDLGTLPGDSTSVALAINDAGDVVGFSAAIGGSQHAVLWSKGTVTDLGTSFPSDVSFANGINASGDIVGYRQHQDPATGTTTMGLLWPAGGAVEELGTFPGGHSSAARAVAVDGTVVGESEGAGASGLVFTHAFTVAPIPPVADAGPDQTDDCTGPLTQVTLDGSGSTGAPGHALTYTWSEGATVLASGAAPTATVGFAVGVHTVTLVVTDGELASKPATVVVTVLDSMPPVTVATVAPAPNAAGWNNSSVTVSFAASGPCSGVVEIHVALDGMPEEILLGATGSVPVSGDGVHEVVFFAVDGAGGTEAPQTLTVRVDTTPPVVDASVSPAVIWPPNGRLVPVTLAGVLHDAMTPGGEPVTVAVSSAGMPALVLATTTDAAGAFSVTFDVTAKSGPHGADFVYTVVVTSQDAAGNVGSETLSVVVTHDKPHGAGSDDKRDDDHGRGHGHDR
jgi:probable HAF family extracellular repeat protein